MRDGARVSDSGVGMLREVSARGESRGAPQSAPGTMEKSKLMSNAQSLFAAQATLPQRLQGPIAMAQRKRQILVQGVADTRAQ